MASFVRSRVHLGNREPSFSSSEVVSLSQVRRQNAVLQRHG
jgi:hypothetical protein